MKYTLHLKMDYSYLTYKTSTALNVLVNRTSTPRRFFVLRLSLVFPFSLSQDRLGAFTSAQFIQLNIDLQVLGTACTKAQW